MSIAPRPFLSASDPSRGGHPHTASLEADADSGRCFLLVDGYRAAEVLVDFLDCEGEIRGLEWLTPPVWLSYSLALSTAEDLLEGAPGLAVDVCEREISARALSRTAARSICLTRPTLLAQD